MTVRAVLAGHAWLRHASRARVQHEMFERVRVERSNASTRHRDRFEPAADDVAWNRSSNKRSNGGNAGASVGGGNAGASVGGGNAGASVGGGLVACTNIAWPASGSDVLAEAGA